MVRNSIPLKVAVGYVAVAVVMVTAIVLVYRNTQSILNINRASQYYNHKRNIADSLVYSMLDVSNNERAVYMGTSKDWEKLRLSIMEAKRLTASLKTLERDSLQQSRMDTLVNMLAMKQANLDELRKVMKQNHHESLLNEKLENLNSGKDSVVIQTKAAKTHQNERTTVEVVRTRKGFFRRLADAFRKGGTDTISIHNDVNRTSTDSVAVPVDVAEEVAGVLSQINKEDKIMSQRKHMAVSKEMTDLRIVSDQLAQRTTLLLHSIRQSEKMSMQKALNKALKARQALLWQISLLALLAILAAAILFWYISKDARKERIYRENLENANEEIQRVMNQRERLLLTITHDIKAPVASISGFIDLMRGYVNDERAKGYIDNIVNSSDHLARLVASLLDYHKLENGQMELHPVTFSPSELVSQATEGMRMLAERKGLTINMLFHDDVKAHRKSDGASPECYNADAFRIRQVLDNLISNAIKYTQKGEISVNAHIADVPSANSHYLTVSVKDTGMGMTPEESRRAFMAFTRLQNAQGIEGTGLGLSITHELVTLLGGKITLNSVKNVGSTFTVTIPVGLATADDKAISCEKADEHIAPAPCKHGKPLVLANQKILILDDDKLQLQLLQEMLRSKTESGWQVFACQHVTDALTILHNEKPAMMLMDIEMPEMSGMEIIRMINHSNMKVIAMTAHDTSIKEELSKAGFDGCLFKPFQRDALDALIGLPSVESPQQSSVSAPSEQRNAYLSELLAFAAGDEKADQEIIRTVTAELHTYRNSLARLMSSPSDGPLPLSELRQEAGRIAHKLLPIATLLHADCLAQLQSLSPEQISNISPDTIHEYLNKVDNNLETILNAIGT